MLDFDGSGRPGASRPGTRPARWLWPVLIAALFCVPLFVGLARTDLDNDESIYSYAVDVMLQSGDWLTPKYIPWENAPFLEKPPLKFWIVAAPIHLGLLPHNEFGFRFWDALFGAAAFLYVFAIGRTIGGPLCGFIAVLVLFLHHPLLFTHGLRSNNMEAAVVLSYCGGIFHFLAWRSSENARARHRHIFALALLFVLGFMTKFVAALFLPVILVAWMLVGRDLGRLWRDRRAWLSAGALALVLIAPWFVYQQQQFGNDLWRIILGQQLFTRFTAGLDASHLRPWRFYFSEILLNLAYSQTTLIVCGGLLVVLFRSLRGWQEGRLILLWFALPLALMSFGSSKLYHYAYPFLPPLALAAGYGCAVVFDFFWSLTARPWPTVRRLVAQSTERAVRSRAVRTGLVGLAAAAVALTIATYMFDHVRLAVGDVVLLRNWTLTRPALVAMLLLVLAGRLSGAVRVLAVLLLMFIVPPASVYRQELPLFSAGRHPLQTMRDCLRPISAAMADRREPAVWVEDEGLTWPFCYYLRGLGPWQNHDTRSDAIVLTHLYAPSQLRPVLLTYRRYEELMHRVRTDPAFLERMAGSAGADPVALATATRESAVTLLRLQDQVLVLPGPYSGCGPEPQR